jgi:hypothetical protein
MLKSTAASSGLAKVFKPLRMSPRFYTGGLLVMSHIHPALYTILENAVIFYRTDSGLVEWSLGEEVSCFCVNPEETEIMVSVFKNSLLHYR